ncbi:MAG: hypothetical protein KGP01_05660 [Actinomycetales bacterium]|nr:hypothetical protein [Actinomycetales bacterium]
MPEGDTVARLARSLDARLRDSVLLHTDFRVPAHATADLTGWQVHEVAARGKHLLMRVVDPSGERRLTIHSHLRMDGSWRVYAEPSGVPAARGRAHTRAGVRAVLRTDGFAVVGEDISELRLLPTREEHTLLSRLGPDPLHPDYNRDEVLRRLRARPDALLGTSLLDQSVMAGIGNVLRCEVLFLCGIHPRRTVADTPDADAVVDAAAELLRTTAALPWRVTTGDARRGRDLWVYGRQRQPCRRCGAGIVRSTSGAGSPGAHDSERIVFFCPGCQR